MTDPKKDSSSDLIPRPDPSELTTRQLEREVHGLRELLETRLVGTDTTSRLVREIIETRLDGMDKAIRLLQDTADKFPDRIDEKITALRTVHEQRFDSRFDTHLEKFSSIQTQFQSAKEAVGEQNKSSALAIAKSETATVKQIDQLATLIQSMTKGFDDKIGDVKDRLTRIEGKGEGSDKTRQTQQSSSSYLVAVIGMVVGLVIGAIGLLMRFGK